MYHSTGTEVVPSITVHFGIPLARIAGLLNGLIL